MKITALQLKQARELAEKHGYTELYINDKGEHFTSANLSALSVGHDKDKWAKIDLIAVVEKEEKSTTDLQNAAELIAMIEAATEVEAIEAIAKAESEGKNRKSVIFSAEKKIESLSKNAQ